MGQNRHVPKFRPDLILFLLKVALMTLRASARCSVGIMIRTGIKRKKWNYPGRLVDEYE
jgi:hypothetical protein